VTPQMPLSALREIDEIALALRPRRWGQFKIRSVARRLGISVESRSLGSELFGLTLDSERVLLRREGLVGSARAFTFAHEVAHVLERRGRFRGVSREQSEWLADRFARELLLPRRWLIGASPEEIQRATTRRWLSPEIVCMQAAAAGRAPDVIRGDCSVLCRRCGERHARPDCECFPARLRPSAAQELPSMHTVLRRLTKPAITASPLVFPCLFDAPGCEVRHDDFGPVVPEVNKSQDVIEGTTRAERAAPPSSKERASAQLAICRTDFAPF